MAAMDYGTKKMSDFKYIYIYLIQYVFIYEVLVIFPSSVKLTESELVR